MTTTQVQSIEASGLSDGAILTGRIKKPFIRDGKLLGAVVAFAGHTETALLHLRQMTGENPSARLAALRMNESVLVRLIVKREPGRRKDVWATENGIEHVHIVEAFSTGRENFANLRGAVHSITEVGIFITMLDGPARGYRGLFRLWNGGDAQATLGSYVEYQPGQPVLLDVAEARIEKSKLLFRVDNVRKQTAA